MALQKNNASLKRHRLKNCWKNEKVQEVIMLEKLPWNKLGCELPVHYSAVILYTGTLPLIICMSTLHYWGTLNKASPASPTSSTAWDAGCTGVVQCHPAPAKLSPALSGAPTQQGPALESLQGNLLQRVRCGDSSSATARESSQSCKLLSYILWVAFMGASRVLSSPIRGISLPLHLCSNSCSCATQHRAPQDTWQTSLLKITSGSALRLELCIDSASSGWQEQIQNYHYANWKPPDLN